MRLEISAPEKQFLIELFDSAEKEFIHELDHTDSREFRAKLKEQLELLEDLRRKLELAA
jgi:hypothetical protein